MSDLKLILNFSRTFPRASGHQKLSWNIILNDPGPSGKIQNFDKNLWFWQVLGLIFLIFAMLTHVLPCGRPRDLSAGDPLPRLEPRVATHASACVYNIYIFIVWYIDVETRLKDGLFYFHAISSVKKCPLAWTWDHDDDHLLASLLAWLL